MSVKQPRITSNEVVKVLNKIGFILDRQKGSHAIYKKDNLRVVVPIHKGKIIKPKTLAGIIEDMDLSIDEFKNILINK